MDREDGVTLAPVAFIGAGASESKPSFYLHKTPLTLDSQYDVPIYGVVFLLAEVYCGVQSGYRWNVDISEELGGPPIRLRSWEVLTRDRYFFSGQARNTGDITSLEEVLDQTPALVVVKSMPMDWPTSKSIAYTMLPDIDPFCKQNCMDFVPLVAGDFKWLSESLRELGFFSQDENCIGRSEDDDEELPGPETAPWLYANAWFRTKTLLRRNLLVFLPFSSTDSVSQAKSTIWLSYLVGNEHSSEDVKRFHCKHVPFLEKYIPPEVALLRLVSIAHRAASPNLITVPEDILLAYQADAVRLWKQKNEAIRLRSHSSMVAKDTGTGLQSQLGTLPTSGIYAEPRSSPPVPEEHTLRATSRARPTSPTYRSGGSDKANSESNSSGRDHDSIWDDGSADAGLEGPDGPDTMLTDPEPTVENDRC